jgi:hypothetical protein
MPPTRLPLSTGGGVIVADLKHGPGGHLGLLEAAGDQPEFATFKGIGSVVQTDYPVLLLACCKQEDHLQLGPTCQQNRSLDSWRLDPTSWPSMIFANSAGASMTLSTSFSLFRTGNDAIDCLQRNLQWLAL